MAKSRLSDAQTVGHEALASYRDVLAFLADAGATSGGRRPAAAELPFLSAVPGIERLLETLSAVAPAEPAAADEEWNPLSQRPHSPLPPPVQDELGSEITALKEAIDAFTTLCHEMLHVALWEPFFAGLWRPRSRAEFREFSLRAEGFCFFFSDVVVTGAVRARLPDGEFALDRQTPSNARFHPVRAFQALDIQDPDQILDIYLEGFNGARTPLWQPRGTSHFVAAIAARVFDFYAGSLGYLDDLHGALTAFGGLSDLYRRHCAIPGLPTFVDAALAPAAGGDLKAYFAAFYRDGLRRLAELTPEQVGRIRCRRMLQMRAYYALQVRWVLQQGRVVASRWSAARARVVSAALDDYLSGLRRLLMELAQGESPLSSLAELDAAYDQDVRAPLVAHDAWVGQRWLILPQRAGGVISAFEPLSPRATAARTRVLQVVGFLMDELTERLAAAGADPARPALAERTALLAEIQRFSGIGAAAGGGSATQLRTAHARLRKSLVRPAILPLWSVPLAAFDPLRNRYRELTFSYQ